MANQRVHVCVTALQPRDVIEWMLLRAGEMHGCFTGDCPHPKVSECVEHLLKEMAEEGE